MEDYQAIRHMYLIDHLSQRTIAERLGISRNTVRKYCEGDILPGVRANYHRSASVVTPEIIQFIQQCFLADEQEHNKKQHHTAKRIYDRLVAEMNFTGSESSIRHTVQKLHETAQNVFVPLVFSPGEAMQIDWGECYVYLNGMRTKIYFFCARLCYSCAPFVVCYRRQNTESFLEALIRAFEFFGGVPRRVIFDNGKVAVKSGYGKKAVCQDRYAALAAHYCFETVFCNPASGNEKGLVENLVGWTRRNTFVPIPHVEGMDELNELTKQQCCSYIKSHKIQQKPQSVNHMLTIDKGMLLPLPGCRYDASRSTECRVNSYATVRFESNNYSVPVRYVGRTVAVKGFAETVCIYADGEESARHIRSYDREKDVLTLAHYLPILERKPGSILNAKPVRQNLCPAMLQWLQDMAFTGKELMTILTDCANKGEAEVWLHKAEYLAMKQHPVCITDPVHVQAVDLTVYNQFLSTGDDALCQKQA